MSSWADSSTDPATVAATLAKVLERHTELRELGLQLESHQNTQRQIISLEREIIQTDAAVMDLLQRLRTAEKMMEDLLADIQYKDRGPSKKNAIDFKQVVSYAHRLAKYTSPPPEGMPIMYPPIPQDAHMKRGLLFQSEGLRPEAPSEEPLLDQEIVMEIDMISKLVKPAQEPVEELDLDLEF